MSYKNLTLFDSERLTLEKSIELTTESLKTYGKQYKHWAISFSGGKDSTATVTLIAYLIESGFIDRPDSIPLPSFKQRKRRGGATVDHERLGSKTAASAQSIGQILAAMPESQRPLTIA